MAGSGRTPWDADVVLADGATVHLRPIRPDDGERLVALHGRLSPTSVYYRFFSAKPRLSAEEVDRFTRLDGVNRVALVAVLGEDMIAVGRYDRWPGRDEAEVAFTVDDAHQGRGIGTVMLEHLAAVARVNGIARFTAQVLPENRAMLNVFRSAGFEVHRSFAGGVVDLEFAIEITPAVVTSISEREQRADSRSIARLLHPRTIAVFGASGRAGSVGGLVARHLVDAGFDGDIYIVNPRSTSIAGLASVATLADVDGNVDLAVVAVPEREVDRVLDDCAARGVRGALVITVAGAGASPASRGERARARGMRLVGPGSYGIVSGAGAADAVPSVMHASLAPVPMLPGRVAVSVQSGPFAGALVEAAQRVGLGVSSFVSLGDQADVSAADLLNYWYGDRATSVILLHTEGYGDPRRFARIARRTSARLPIVAVRPLLPGADEAAAVAFEQRAGVIRVRTVRELIDTGRVFADQPRPRGGRAGIVTNTRAGAALATSAMRGADLVSAGVHDLGPNADAAAYADAVSAVVDDDGVDIVVVIYAPPLAPDSHVVEAIELVSRRHREARGGAAKPIVAVALGAGDGPLVRGGTVPAFRFPEHAIDALAAARRHRVHAGELPIADGENEAAIDRERLGAMRAAATRLVSLDERAVAASRDYVDVAALLRAAGLRVIAAIPVATVDEALAAGARAGFPVALKVAGMKRPGRSEAGGIALDLHDAEALRGAYERMDNRLGPAMAHAVVQAMAPPGVDVRVVIENHVDYGPMVSFGLGGLYADVIGDGPCRAVPLTAADRRDLVAESRASVALAQAHLALDAVDEVIAAASALGEHVWELDRLVMNPILVSAAGAFVLDAEATVTSRPEPQRDYVRHL